MVGSQVWQKGMLTAKRLFYLVLDLRLAARGHEVWLNVFHIYGNRMIITGMDGWSQGNFYAGISLGYNLHQYFPVNMSAFNYEGQTLADWCKSWMGPNYSPPLEPSNWYGGEHLPGVHIWLLPPEAALKALNSWQDHV